MVLCKFDNHLPTIKAHIMMFLTPIVWERGVGGCQPGRCDMGDRSTRWSLVHPAINAPDVSLTTYYYLIPWLCEDRTVSDNVCALCLSSPCNSWQTHIDYCWQSQCSITPHSDTTNKYIATTKAGCSRTEQSICHELNNAATISHRKRTIQNTPIHLENLQKHHSITLPLSVQHTLL